MGRGGLREVLVGHPVAFRDGADEQVGDKTDGQQTAHNVQNKRIGVGFVAVGGDVVVEDAVDDEGTENASRGPCGEKSAVDGGNVEAAKQVFEIRGDGGEAATVHGDGKRRNGDEKVDRPKLPDAGGRHEEVEQDAENEEDEVGGFASKKVGCTGPEEATCHVEDGQNTNESNRGRGGDDAFEEVLNHRGGLLEDSDPSRNVGEKDDPQQPELGCTPGVLDVDVASGDERRGLGLAGPAFGLPALGRDADGEDSEHHEDEIENAHRDPGIGDRRLSSGFEMRHELIAQGTADHGASAKTHDGKAGGEPRPVGEPLDERRYRRDVTETKADASDDTIAEEDEGERVERGSKGRDPEAAAETKSGVEHGAPGTGSFQPGSEECGGKAQEEDGY